MTEYNQLKNIFDLIQSLGIEKALPLIDIESIEQLSIKIILRTIQTSHENLLNELSEALTLN